MKKIVLLVALLLGMTAQAQIGSLNPNISASGKAQSKKSTIVNQPDLELGILFSPGLYSLGYYSEHAEKGGLGVGANVGLDLRYKPKKTDYWWSFGFALSKYGSKSIYNTMLTTPTMQDPVYGYNYELESRFINFIERQSLITLGIPIGWYKEIGSSLRFGIGVELGSIMSANYRLISGTIETSYHDADLDVWFGPDLNAHGAGTTEYGSGSKKQLSVKNVMVSPFFDLSYKIDKVSVGAYMGYDLINLYRGVEYSNQSLVSISEGSMSYNGVLHSNQVSGVHPWTIGIRFRYAVSVAEKVTKTPKAETSRTDTKHESGSAGKDPSSAQPEVGKVASVNSISEYDTMVVNMMKMLIDREPLEKPIARAIRLYNKMPDSPYKKSEKGTYDALVHYPIVYKEFQNIIKTAVRDLQNRGTYSPVDVAQRCKDEILKNSYWTNRDNIDYLYPYLDAEISKILQLVNTFLAEGSKMKTSEFRSKFGEAVQDLLPEE